MSGVLHHRYKESLIADLAAFVRIPSRSSPEGGDEGELQATIAAGMRELGARVHTFEAHDLPQFPAHPLCHGPERQYDGRPTVVAEVGPSEAPALLVLAHSDTVQVNSPGEWSIDPFSGDIRDGAVWGLGASDDKWGLASMLTILRALHDAARPLQKRLIFASTIDEEHGVGNGTLLLALSGVHAESALYLDGHELKICIGNLGGSNFALVPQVPIAEEERCRRQELLGELCVRMSQERSILFDRPYYRENWAHERSISFLPASDAVPYDRIAFYTLPGEERPAFCARLEREVAQVLGDRSGEYAPDYREPWFEPAFAGDRLPLVRHLSASIRERQLAPPVVTTISKQDAFVLTNHAGIPTVSFGGRMKSSGRGTFHQPDECMPVEEVWRAAAIAYGAVCRWLEED